MHPEYTPKDAVNFWKHVDRSGGDDACWPWIGCRNHHEYGRFVIHGSGRPRCDYAHRVSWMIHHGDVPDGMCVCHNCPEGDDHPWCVNPRHLFLGTVLDNVQDAIRKGHRGKLTPALVVRARELAGMGWRMSDIAAELGCTPSNIGRVLQGDTWGHVAGGQDAASVRKRSPRKLTPELAAAVRTAARTATQQEVARRFGISQGHVSEIVAGKKW